MLQIDQRYEIICFTLHHCESAVSSLTYIEHVHIVLYIINIIYYSIYSVYYSRIYASLNVLKISIVNLQFSCENVHVISSAVSCQY